MSLTHLKVIRENVRMWERQRWFSVCEVAKWEKIRQILHFADYDKIRNFLLINIFGPTFVPTLATWAWKMSPGMPKETGSLNGPFCAY